AELRRPVAFRAELRPPRPEPPGREVQAVLVREPDGAVDLMGDTRPDAGRLAHAHLGDRHFEPRVAALGGATSMRSRHAGRAGVTGQAGQLMPGGLKSATCPP